MKLHKYLAFLLAILMLLTAVGCSSSSDAEETYPNRAITLITPYSAGGSTDIGARMIAAEMEEILGVSVAVVNTVGASGWIGWNDLLSADPDGYTIAHLNTPNVFSGYLDPQQGRDNTIEDFEPIFCYVNDLGAIAIRPDETRFTNLEELIAYAQENEVTTTSTGIFGDDHTAAVKMNAALGTNFLPVHNEGAGESLTAVMGGHVDVMFANVGDVLVPTEGGQVVTIGIMGEERSTLMPDVPTVEEITGEQVLSSSARGITGMAGMDENAYNVLLECFQQIGENEEIKAQMEAQGLEYNPIYGDDYMDLLKQEEAGLIAISDLLGWS